MATANLLQTSVSGGTQNALSLQGDGVFFPKASTTSRLALTLTTTDKGFIVYDTTDNNIYFWNGTAWESVPSSGDAGANGSVQYNDAGIVSGASNFVYDKATGSVGIGNAPVAVTRLYVRTAAPTDRGFASDNGTNADFVVQYASSLTTIGAELNVPLAFKTNNIERMRLTGGNLSLANGNVVMGTANKGIDFSINSDASATSELLNDYEEGTWTIGLTFNGASVGITTNANTGRYTKIGRQVTVIGYLSLTSKGSSTGAANITGLPFASPNSLDSFSASCLRFYVVSYTGTIQGVQLINSTKIELDNISEAGTVTSLTDANFSNTSSIMLSVTYFV